MDYHRQVARWTVWWGERRSRLVRDELRRTTCGEIAKLAWADLTDASVGGLETRAYDNLADPCISN